MSGKNKILKTISIRNKKFKLKVELRKTRKNKATNQVRTQKDAILYFIQRLDLNMISLILENHNAIEFDKNEFVERLEIAFNNFLESGDKHLNRYKGICNNKFCNLNCKGFSFVGNNSGKHYDLILETKNDLIIDFGECRNFSIASKVNIKRSRNIIWDDPDFIPF